MSKTVAQATAEFWLKNARLRHGHPPSEDDLIPDRETVKETVKETYKEVPVGIDKPDEVVDNSVNIVAQAAPSLLRKLMPYVVGAALGGGPLLGYTLFKSAPTPAQTEERDGSVLQYLEDNNWHLPE